MTALALADEATYHADYQRAAELWAEHQSTGEIAKLMGVPEHVIWNRLDAIKVLSRAHETTLGANRERRQPRERHDEPQTN